MANLPDLTGTIRIARADPVRAEASGIKYYREIGHF
jgi:hypothetical protein